MTIASKGALNFGDQGARLVSDRIYGFVDAETDLDNIPSDKRKDGMIAVVVDDVSVWIFDADSSAAEVTGSVRQPASGTGRWLRSGTTLAEANARVYPAVADAAAMQAIAAANRTDGQIVVKKDDDTIWTFDSGSAAGASDWVIVPSAGTGRWLRNHVSLADLSSTATGKGLSLLGMEDAGGFTTANDGEEAFAEIYQHLRSTQGSIDLKPSDFYLLTGAPLAIFADGASAVPGSALVDSKAFGIRWNDNATQDAVVTSFLMPPDADVTADMTVTIRASKTGATLADAVTFDVGAFNQVVGALHDADVDFGGVSSAMVGDAAAKTIQAVTRTLALADLAASPASVTLSIKPTNGTLATDDLVLHSVQVSYTKKLLTS